MTAPLTERGLRRIADDLWETPTDTPFPGLTTHAYVWASPSAGNVLFYSVATSEGVDELAGLGGVAHQYLSHRDEAGPILAEIARRFGSRLHASAAEVDEVATHHPPDELFRERVREATGVEVIPTPGHSPGSTCFVVEGVAGRYLFTGDTLYRTSGGTWAAGYLQGISDAAALARSLDLLAELEPDLVVSSAFSGDAGAHRVAPGQWREWLDQARASLPSD